MKPSSRKASLLVEMIGSAVICGVAFVADLLIDARHRRAATTPSQ